MISRNGPFSSPRVPETGVPSAQGLVLRAKEMEREMDKAAKEFKRKIAERKKKKGKH